MTDQPQINPLASNNADYWSNYWRNPNNMAKPVSGNALQTQTQQLNTAGSVNLENPAATGFASSTQGVNNPAFNPQGSIPDSDASRNATGQNISAVEQAAVGNNQAQIQQQGEQASLGNITGQLNAMNPQGSGQGQVQGQQSAQSGLPSSIFQSAVSNMASGFTSIPSMVNNFGQTLGFGSAGGASEAISPALAAADPSLGAATIGAENVGSLTSASLSGTLGAAGLGYLGGGLISNFTGGNKMGSSIGGALGAAAGYAIGGMSGTEIGALIGSIIPGFGTIVGGLIGGIGGSLLGGMFGNGSQPTSNYNIGANLTASGALGETNYSAGKNGSPAQANQIQQAFGNITTNASSALGISFNPEVNIMSGYNSLHSPGGSSAPDYIQVSPPNNGAGTYYSFNPADPTSTSTAYFQALTQAANLSGFTDTAALHDWYYGGAGAGTGNNQDFGNVTIAPRMT